MKFILWLLSITNRHRRDIRRYEQGGRGGRIAVIVISVILATLVIGCEIGFLSVFFKGVAGEPLTNFIILFGIGILGTAILGAFLDYSACFMYVGFRMAMRGFVIGGIEKAAIVGNIVDEPPEENEKEESEEAPVLKKESFKGLDIFVGFFELLWMLAILALFIHLLFAYPVLIS